MPRGKKKIEYYEGQQLGNCIFLKDTKIKEEITKRQIKKRRYALFKCNCGIEFEALIESVKFKGTKSCGCLFVQSYSEKKLPINITHGESIAGIKSPEYSTWLRMKERCKETNINSRKWYFDKGITVCDEWKNSFKTFLKDIGRKPSKYHSIDRIDSNKGYFKDNCRWATAEEQSNNISTNVNVTFKGKTQSLSMWAKEIEVSPSTIAHRLKKNWALELALTTRTKPESRISR